jgi:hypothetical protein
MNDRNEEGMVLILRGRSLRLFKRRQPSCFVVEYNVQYRFFPPVVSNRFFGWNIAPLVAIGLVKLTRLGGSSRSWQTTNKGVGLRRGQSSPSKRKKR